MNLSFAPSNIKTPIGSVNIVKPNDNSDILRNLCLPSGNYKFDSHVTDLHKKSLANIPRPVEPELDYNGYVREMVQVIDSNGDEVIKIVRSSHTPHIAFSKIRNLNKFTDTMIPDFNKAYDSFPDFRTFLDFFRFGILGTGSYNHPKNVMIIIPRGNKNINNVVSSGGDLFYRGKPVINNFNLNEVNSALKHTEFKRYEVLAERLSNENKVKSYTYDGNCMPITSSVFHGGGLVIPKGWVK